jgi:hypothetical protein
MEFEGLRVSFRRIAAGKFDQQKCWIANLPTLERYLRNNLLHVLQRSSLSISFTLQSMAQQITPNSFINTNRKQSILKPMPQTVKRMVRRFAQTIAAQKLVHDSRQTR